ncbi:MAG: hypothetical protein WC515_03535 [Candidatus Omnitrophota bacterium]
MNRRQTSKAIEVRPLTRAASRAYGLIIDASCVDDRGRGNSFGILLKERSSGWRIGYLIVREKRITRLERHRDSLETFEPVKGRVVIALAPDKYPDKAKLFLLDRPFVVKKGVWHDVAGLSGRAEVKIFENIEVETDYHELDREIYTGWKKDRHRIRRYPAAHS